MAVNFNDSFPPGNGDKGIDNYIKKVMQILKICPKVSNELIGWHHYTDYKGIALTMNKIQLQLHSLIATVFNHQDINLNFRGLDLEKIFDLVREGNDALLERINNDLDEASGIRTDAYIDDIDNEVRTIRGPINNESRREVTLVAAKNVQKPQMFFSTKVNNSTKEPFLPKLKEKPNSIKPLSVMLSVTDDDREYYSHPYEYEQQHWSPADELLSSTEPIQSHPLEQTSLRYINTREELLILINELTKCKEIAVDLEHHSFRSYLGLTCLIQISTREKDYVIDPFTLMDDLVMLNEIFTNPKITKVFHGADQDILWLQRDFSVYVVNMFDTHQAAVILDYPHRSLAALLHSFCSITANKKYQRADWRIRPLPDDFISYARQDTHDLLYIYDLLRNELIANGNDLNNLLNAVYDRSTEICMKRFEKPFVDSNTYLNLYRKSRKTLNNRQLHALKEVFLWRDKLAREQDESVDYILPKHMMLQLAEVLPKEMQGILSCCNPIPINVKTGQLALHQIFRAARELPLEDISITNEATQLYLEHLGGAMQEFAGPAFICRHDLSQVEENISDLNTMLNPQQSLFGDLFQQDSMSSCPKQDCKLFGNSLNCDKMWNDEITPEYSSPFERYTMYLDIQSSLEEVEPVAPAPVKTENLVSLENRPETNLKLDPESDLNRISRLQHHIARVSTESGESLGKEQLPSAFSTPTTEEFLTHRREQIDNEQSPESDIGRLMRIQQQVTNATGKANKSLNQLRKKRNNKKKSILDMKQKEEKDKSKSGRKRKSSENHRDQTEKLMKSETKVNVDEKADIEECDDVSTPFDYSTADYSMFSKNKGRGKNRNRKIKEKFKAKTSNKPTGSKKKGFKTMSWGVN